MSRKYLSVAETAKLVRLALKESFPGVKFSVKSSSYSGGGAIDVSWIDGPAAMRVDAVVGAFEGAYFDAMIDYKGSKFSKLDGEPVSFGADFIHTNRKSSAAQIERAIKFLQAKYPNNGIQASAEQYSGGNLWNVYPLGGDWSYNNNLQSMIGGVLGKLSSVAAPLPSPTLARVQSAGDDGYGAGTVGQDGKGGESCYKAIAEAQERQAAADRAQSAVIKAIELGSAFNAPAVVQ